MSVSLFSVSLDCADAGKLGLGASHLGDVDEGGYQRATLADPEGNEFDIVAAPQ